MSFLHGPIWFYMPKVKKRWALPSALFSHLIGCMQTPFRLSPFLTWTNTPCLYTITWNLLKVSLLIIIKLPSLPFLGLIIIIIIIIRFNNDQLSNPLNINNKVHKSYAKTLSTNSYYTLTLCSLKITHKIIIIIIII
jgi:hypothetical protein